MDSNKYVLMRNKKFIKLEVAIDFIFNAQNIIDFEYVKDITDSTMMDYIDCIDVYENYFNDDSDTSIERVFIRIIK